MTFVNRACRMKMKQNIVEWLPDQQQTIIDTEIC